MDASRFTVFRGTVAHAFADGRRRHSPRTQARHLEPRMVHDARDVARAHARLFAAPTRRAMARTARFPATSRTSWRAATKTSRRCAATRATRCRRHLAAGSRRRRMPRGCCFPTMSSVSPAASRCRTMASPSAADCRSPVARTYRISRWATMCGAASSCGCFPGRRANSRLLSVHLKSGCARDRAGFAPARLPRARAPGPGARALDRCPGRRTQALRGTRRFQSRFAARTGRSFPLGRDRRRSIHQRRTWSIRPRDRLFRTACPRRPSAATSITSFWAARWPRGLVQTPSDACFTDPRTPPGANCQITARYSSGFGWQTPPPHRRKPQDVKFFAKPIKLSSVQMTRLSRQ